MAITTTAKLTNELVWSQTDTVSTSSTQDQVSVKSEQSLTNGTGLTQANTVWLGSGTLTSGGSVTIDLYNLSRDIFGSTLSSTFQDGNIKLLSVKNTSTATDQTFKLDNSLANGFTRYSDGAGCNIQITPSGSFTVSNMSAGYDTSAANRYLRLVDEGQAASYEIGIVGAV